ncbi:MAG: hypothetical protein EOP45_17580 [Sphingobacteriaceae bacterium]|nr:MAG: hypothetical protein EOP45_17580 [Sphingobacteriaceae bacterium]
MAKEDLFISEVEQEISLQEQIRKVEKLIISAPTEDKEYLLEKSYKLRHQLYDLLLHRAQTA